MVLVVGMALLIFYFQFFSNPEVLSGPDGKILVKDIKQVTIGEAVIKVEVAVSPQSRQQGLSGRGSLGADEGMLFIFEEKSRHQFWMKGMNFALDFIWIADGSVVDISQRIPAPFGTFDLPRILRPAVKVDQVLEVNAGVVESSKIKIGDKVTYN